VEPRRRRPSLRPRPPHRPGAPGLGQERPVTIYRLVAQDTIEERILQLHAGKRDLADGLLVGTEDGGRLSYAEMLALVRGGE